MREDRKMTKEELHIKAIDNANSRVQSIDKRYITSLADYDLGLIQGYEDGAEQMLNNPTGGALLYAVEKTAERTKREMIGKAERFIHDTIYNWAGGYEGKTWEQKRKEYIEMFKQAMEE